jgi:hypothetical protein
MVAVGTRRHPIQVSQQIPHNDIAAGKPFEERYELLGVVDVILRVGEGPFKEGGQSVKGGLVIAFAAQHRPARVKLHAPWNVTRQHALYEASMHI